MTTRGRFRVMTANLRNGGTGPAALADLVHRVAPDAVLVQELKSLAGEV